MLFFALCLRLTTPVITSVSHRPQLAASMQVALLLAFVMQYMSERDPHLHNVNKFLTTSTDVGRASQAAICFFFQSHGLVIMEP